MTDEHLLIEEILVELGRARAKFPGDNVTTLALVEEVGEVATATFEEPRDAVRKEAIQTAVMAMRLILDGDATLRLWRALRGLDPLTEGEHLDGATSIALERQRQINEEGWTGDGDDERLDVGDLANAAACYAREAFHDNNYRPDGTPVGWPWSAEWWKPGPARRCLEKAGALVAAEIDKQDRRGGGSA